MEVADWLDHVRPQPVDNGARQVVLDGEDVPVVPLVPL
jgi:hypothetical protein